MLKKYYGKNSINEKNFYFCTKIADYTYLKLKTIVEICIGHWN